MLNNIVNKVGKRKTSLVVDVYLMICAAIALAAGAGNLALLLAMSGYTCLYFRVRSLCSQRDWSLHPLRLLIPLTTLFQFMYWVWFGLLEKIRPETRFDWMLPVIDGASMGGHLANYFLWHYLFFVSIALGFEFYRRNRRYNNNRVINLDMIKVLLVASVVIPLANLGNYGGLTGNTLLTYVASITNRLFPTVIGLLCFISLKKPAWSFNYFATILLLIVSIVAGFFVSMETNMRFSVLQQLLIVISVSFVLIIQQKRRDLVMIFISLLSLGIALFFFTTVNKVTSGGGQYTEKGYGTTIQFIFERSLQRLAPFTTDAIVIENGIQGALFDNPAVSSIRIFKAIPFLYNLVGFEDSGRSLEVEKLIYFRTNKSGVDSWDTSIFIAGTSEAVFSYGMLGGALIIIVMGFVQGFSIWMSVRICGNISWVNIISQYVLYALLGLDFNNFLRLPINIVLGALLIRFLRKRSEVMYCKKSSSF